MYGLQEGVHNYPEKGEVGGREGRKDREEGREEERESEEKRKERRRKGQNTLLNSWEKLKLLKSFLSLQHHCRKCGGIFCGACSTKRFPLLDRGFSDPVRVCDKCYNVLTRNS